MTNLLLDMLKASAPSRVVTVSSEAYYLTNMHWEDLMLEEEGSYSGMVAYGQSKLANILFSAELGRRLQGRCSNVQGVFSCMGDICTSKVHVAM